MRKLLEMVVKRYLLKVNTISRYWRLKKWRSARITHVAHNTTFSTTYELLHQRLTIIILINITEIIKNIVIRIIETEPKCYGIINYPYKTHGFWILIVIWRKKNKLLCTIRAMTNKRICIILPQRVNKI